MNIAGTCERLVEVQEFMLLNDIQCKGLDHVQVSIRTSMVFLSKANVLQSTKLAMDTLTGLEPQARL